MLNKFQFHKGTIKTQTTEKAKNFAFHFNSIKVRLKLRLPILNYKIFYQFQFHKGTIKTYELDRFTTDYFLFQFHKGTIKTSAALCGSGATSYFNSIKVRLKPTSPRPSLP